jgi:hypothetical protein
VGKRERSTLLSTMNVKAKTVPLHAMKVLGRRGSTAPTLSQSQDYMGVSGQRHAPTAL